MHGQICNSKALVLNALLEFLKIYINIRAVNAEF